MNIAWYIPFQIPLLLHILRFLFFFSDNIMADVASKQNDSLVFIHHSHTYKKTHRTDKKKKPDKPDGKPVLCQRTFNSVFRAVFFLHCQTAQFNLGCMGPFKVYGAL